MNDTAPRAAGDAAVDPLHRLSRSSPLRLLAHAGRVYARQLPLLVGAAAFTLVPVTLLQAYLLRDVTISVGTDPADIDPQAASVFAVFGAAYLVVITPLLAAVLLRAIAERQAGVGATVDELYSYGFSRLLTVMMVAIASGIAVGAGFVLFVLPGIYLLARLYLAIPAAVVEDGGVVASLRRSWHLTSDAIWRVLAVVVVAFGALLAATLASQRLLAMVGVAGSWVVTGLVDGLTSAATLPFGFAVSMSLYLDARARRDGLTTTGLRAELGAEDPGAW